MKRAQETILKAMSECQQMFQRTNVSLFEQFPTNSLLLFIPLNSLCNISAQPGHKGPNVKGVKEPIV